MKIVDKGIEFLPQFCNWGRKLRLGHTLEVAAWEIAQFGSFHLGKYSWEVATWEKSFGKVPNI